MLLMVEKGMIGGYTNANNKCIKDYNENKESSLECKYFIWPGNFAKSSIK